MDRAYDAETSGRLAERIVLGAAGGGRRAADSAYHAQKSDSPLRTGGQVRKFNSQLLNKSIRTKKLIILIYQSEVEESINVFLNVCCD